MNTDHHRPSPPADVDSVSSSDRQRPNLRHTHRITIGGSNQPLNEISTSCYDQLLDPKIEAVSTKPSVTIVRLPSQQRGRSLTAESAGSGKADSDRSTTACAEAYDNTRQGCPSQTLSLRTYNRAPLRSPGSKHYYPPSSWKDMTWMRATPIATKGSYSSDGTSHSARSVEVPGSDTPSMEILTMGRTASSPDPTANTSSTILSNCTTISLSSSTMQTFSETRPMQQPSKLEAALHEDRNALAPHPFSTSETLSVSIQSHDDPSKALLSHAPRQTPTFTKQSEIPKEQQSWSPSFTCSTELPDPETAYVHIFYFTTCPHTSPPSSRPLNVEPVLTQYHDDLLAYPLHHLRVTPDGPLNCRPDIYIIEGSCGHCDSVARRGAETAILDEYADNIDELSERLCQLKLDIESVSTRNPSLESVSLRSLDSGAWSESTTASLSITDTASNPCRSGSNIRLSSSHIRGIIDLERQLNSMIRQRDREVKTVWKGYTARWGPATLGVHHAHDHNRNNNFDQEQPFVSCRQQGRKVSIGTNTTTDREQRSNSRGLNLSSETSSEDSSRDGISTTLSSTTTTAETTTTATTVAAYSRRPSCRQNGSGVSAGSGAGSSVSSGFGSSVDSKSGSASFSSMTSHHIGPRERYSDGTREITVSSSSVDGVMSDGRMLIDWIRPERKSRTKAKTGTETETEMSTSNF